MNKLTEFREVRHIPELLMPWIPGEEPLEDGVLYVVDSKDQKEQFVEYNCPCGCGKTVWIPYYVKNQQKEQFPSWGFSENAGKVTLSPSVYSTGFPCKSHYFVRENKVQWC